MIHFSRFWRNWCLSLCCQCWDAARVRFLAAQGFRWYCTTVDHKSTLRQLFCSQSRARTNAAVQLPRHIIITIHCAALHKCRSAIPWKQIDFSDFMTGSDSVRQCQWVRALQTAFSGFVCAQIIFWSRAVYCAWIVVQCHLKNKYHNTIQNTGDG